MPRTRSVAWAELKVGIAVIAAIVLVTAMVLAVGGESGYWWQRYPLKTRFANVKGLKPGAVVRLGGKEIGLVKGVEFAGSEVEVSLEILKEVRPLITTASTAEIGSLSLLGEPIVDIRPGPAGRPLNDNEYVKGGVAPGSFDELASTASVGLQNIDKLLQDVRAGRGTLGKLVTDDALYTEMQAFVTAASSVTRSLNAGRGTLGALVKDPAAYDALKTSLENLQALTARINAGQGTLGKLLNDETMGKSLSNTTTNMEQVTGRLSRGEGTAGKLLTDAQLYERLNSMASRVDTLMAGLDAGQGTAGRLLHDQQLYENMNRAVTELRDLLAEIRKDPKKYLRMNVSIF